MTDNIIFSQVNHIGLITLNRANALNALTLEMIQALQQQLRLWEQDLSVHAVVVQANEGKAFCAGGDVRWLYAAKMTQNLKQMQFFTEEYHLNYYIHCFKKPYIAFMNGITMGGGVGISLHGSHPVATEHFLFAMPETGIGFFPDIGASFLLSRCPGATGIYLALTGQRLSAHEAFTLDLNKYVIHSHTLQDVLEQLIQADLSRNAHEMVSACLQTFGQQSARATLPAQEIIDKCFVFNTVEEILAALQQEGSEWSLQTLANLQGKSPLSLKVTLMQMHKAKTMTMAQCIAMDECLAKHFMRDHDFYEGIRALLIDKDQKPNWQPASLKEVSDAMVNFYFT